MLAFIGGARRPSVPVVICRPACTGRNLLTCAGDCGPPSAEIALVRLTVAFCVLRFAAASPALTPEAVERGVNRRPTGATGAAGAAGAVGEVGEAPQAGLPPPWLTREWAPGTRCFTYFFEYAPPT